MCLILFFFSLKKKTQQWICGVTLHGADRGLCETDVVFCDVVCGLVLGDLHTGTHIALPMQEEGEGA